MHTNVPFMSNDQSKAMKSRANTCSYFSNFDLPLAMVTLCVINIPWLANSIFILKRSISKIEVIQCRAVLANFSTNSITALLSILEWDTEGAY